MNQNLEVDGFTNLKEIDAEIDFFKSAKLKGGDIVKECEIAFLNDLVEKIDFILKNDKLKEYLTKNSHLPREELMIKVCDSYLNLEFGEFTLDLLVENCVRSVLAIATEGVVSTPIEGFVKAKIKENPDKTKFIALYFAGPIRAAGATGQIVCIIAGCYLSKKLNLDGYKPVKDEIARYVHEIAKYSKIHPRQRRATEYEIERLVKECPVCITGTGSEIDEVDYYKFIPQVETPKLRGGMVLVITEGMFLKYKKAMDYARIFKLDWSWLEDIIVSSDKQRSMEKNTEVNEPQFLRAIAAGRPVFSLGENTICGFRLRLGRSRNTGLGTGGIHPNTIKILKFINIGSQIMIDYPSKAISVATVDSLDGLKAEIDNGDFLDFSKDENMQYVDRIQKIYDLGEILISYNDFLEAGQKIVVLDYCNEKWVKILKNNNLVLDNSNELSEFQLLTFSQKHKIHLHPSLVFVLNHITFEDYVTLREHFRKTYSISFIISSILKTLGICYKIVNFKYNFEYPLTFEKIFLLNAQIEVQQTGSVIDFINAHNSFILETKGKFYIGSRLGRVESAGMAALTPKINMVYDIGSLKISGNVLQRIMKNHSKVKINKTVRECPICQGLDIFDFCQYCKIPTKATDKVKSIIHNFANELITACKNLKIPVDKYDLKVGNRTLVFKDFEKFEKGLLRAKYGLSVIKDGTIRFNGSNSSLTHIKPIEVGVEFTRFIELGYTHDIYNKPLENNLQILLLKPTDIVIPFAIVDDLLKTTQFIDELLTVYYHSNTFYNCKVKLDLVGLYTIGLAPHTFAGIIGRVVGFTIHNVILGSPIYHAAKRRNTDGDQDSIILLGDAMLNFSKLYLKQGNGALMNIPAIVCRYLKISQIDKEARNLQTCYEYPDQLYFRSEVMPAASFKVPIVKSIKDGTEWITDIGFSVNTDRVFLDYADNAYKQINTMTSKINAQLMLCQTLQGVSETMVARKVIETHLLPDLIGNTRKFLSQNFRCTACKETYRMPPLKGYCKVCRKDLNLTIYPNSAAKYVKYVILLNKRFEFPQFLKERINSAVNELRTIVGIDVEKPKEIPSLLKFRKIEK